jgi:hypothetical protein
MHVHPEVLAAAQSAREKIHTNIIQGEIAVEETKELPAGRVDPEGSSGEGTTELHSAEETLGGEEGGDTIRESDASALLDALGGDGDV